MSKQRSLVQTGKSVNHLQVIQNATLTLTLKHIPVYTGIYLTCMHPVCTLEMYYYLYKMYFIIPLFCFLLCVKAQVVTLYSVFLPYINVNVKFAKIYLP